MLRLVKSPSPIFASYMGMRKYNPEEALRPFRYLLTEDVDDGHLLYNPLTRCMVLASPGWRHDESCARILAERWFLVPESTDDSMLVHQFRDLVNTVDEGVGNIYGYTILTTTDCNARCWFCFEQGVKRVSMTRETALQTTQFIRQHYGGGHVHINWFGGEPLYNAPVMDIICKQLMEWGIDYDSSMLTNGWLFSPYVVKKAVSLWHLTHVQMTMEGTRDVYNHAKNYIYRNKDAFNRVISNICAAADAGIKVSVRLTFDPKNADDLFKFVDETGNYFGNRKDIYIYPHEFFEKDCYDYHSPRQKYDETVRSRDVMDKLKKRIKEMGYGSPNAGHGLPDDVTSHFCQADTTRVIVISPEGKLGRCDYEIESGFCGDVWHGITDKEAYNASFETYPDLPLCSDCPYYVDCIRLKCCDKPNVCDEDLKRRHTEHIKRDMLATYEKWKKNEEGRMKREE